MIDISDLSPRQLLKLYADIEVQLRNLKLITSANNPTGDLAEIIFCSALGWERANKSEAHFDAAGKENGKLYQIKARRIIGDSRLNSSRQLSALRGLGEKHFDFLAGLLFN